MTSAGFPVHGQPGLLADALRLSLPQVAVLLVTAIGDRAKPGAHLEACISDASGHSGTRQTLAALERRGYLLELCPGWWRVTPDGFKLRDLLCALGRFAELGQVSHG